VENEEAPVEKVMISRISLHYVLHLSVILIANLLKCSLSMRSLETLMILSFSLTQRQTASKIDPLHWHRFTADLRNGIVAKSSGIRRSESTPALDTDEISCVTSP